jgi:hypothetical protein
MPPLALPPATIAYALAVVVLLGWNVVYGGRIARLRRAPRPLAALSGLCALLVVPALLVHLSAGSLLGGRTVGGVAWLWPATTVLFLAQAAYATARRYVTPLVGVPLVVHDVVIATVAVTRWVLETTGRAPEPLVALSAAQTAILGVWVGTAALSSPLAVAVPLVAPAYPARWRLTRATRALIAVGAAFAAAVTLLELPRGVGAVRSYRPYAAERLRERPRGDLAIGVKLFTTLDGPPLATTARWDLALLDSVATDAVHVVLAPGAMTFAALDSLARALDPARRDSTALVVTMAFAEGDALRRAADPAGFEARRLALVDRVARALRPDVILPAGAPYAATTLATAGLRGPDEWRRHLTAAAARAHAVNARIRVGVQASSYDAADSALFVWSLRPDAPLDVAGFTVHPSFAGAGGVDARLRAADRWMRAAAPLGRDKALWVFDVHAYPAAHGEASQERTVWHTIAWASAHPAVRGVVVAEPGDYTRITGLRAANGRLRGTVFGMRRALATLRETVVP